MSIVSKIAAIAAMAIVAGPATAATYSFNVQVVESQDLPDFGFTLPGIGTIGTVSFTLDAAALDADGDPMTGLNIDNGLDPMLANASASIGGLTSSLEPGFGTVFGFNERARFSNGDFASISISQPGQNCSALGCTLAGDFSIIAPPGSGTPTTFADVDAFLNDPASTVWFRFNGTVVGQSVSFRAESVPATPVPLPASGVLLLAALGGAAVLRRKR